MPKKQAPKKVVRTSVKSNVPRSSARKNVSRSPLTSLRRKLKSWQTALGVLVIVVLGFVLWPSFAASVGMGTDCMGPRTEVVNKQQLLCDVTAQHEPSNTGSVPFPYIPNGHGQQYTPTFSYAAGNQYGPPPVDGVASDMSKANWDSVHTWLELTSDTTNKINASVESRYGGQNLAFHMKSTNTWIVGNAQSDVYNLSFWGWGYESGIKVPFVDASTMGGNSPDWLLGFGNIFGDNFMQQVTDLSGSSGRLRDHGGIWGQNPNTNYGDVDAVVGWGTYRVIGPDKNIANYRLETGIDKANLADQNGVGWGSYAGRLRRVTPEWQTFTTSTMSKELLDKAGYADKLVGVIPGYTTSTTATPIPPLTPTPTPKPVTPTPVTPTPTPGTSLGNGVYDDTVAAYSGAWIADTNPGNNYSNTEHYSNTPGNTATIRFTGEQLKLTSHRNYDMGQATVTIDGVAQSTPGDWYAGAYTANSVNWTSPKLAKTAHTAVITVSANHNSNFVSIDRIDVSDAPALLTPTPKPATPTPSPTIKPATPTPAPSVATAPIGPASIGLGLNYDWLQGRYNIYVTWPAATGTVTGYEVRKGNLLLTTTPATQRSLADYAVAADGVYTYQVFATNGALRSAGSTPYSTTIRCFWMFCSLQ